MSAVTVEVRDVAFGVCEPKPLRHFPSGRSRIRMRNTDFVQVFIKTENGIRKYLARDCGDAWEPSYEQSANHRRDIP